MTELKKIIAAQECLSNTVMHPCSSCDFAGHKETCIVECAKATLKLLKGMDQISFEGTFLNREDYVNIGDIMDCLSEVTLSDDAAIHAASLIEWAMGKRAISRRELMKAWEQEGQREYEAAVEMAEYCERYEPTYNPEDGSM